MAAAQQTVSIFDIEVSNGCFLLGELAQEGARQRSPPVWVVVKAVDGKPDKCRAHYCFDPNPTGGNGKRSTVPSDQEARIRLNQSIKHHLRKLRIQPTWDTASRVEKSNSLCTLANNIADGIVPSFYRGDEEDVRLTRGGVELEQLRDLARFLPYEADPDEHAEIGDNSGNGGAFGEDNDPGNGARNNRTGSSDQGSGSVSQVNDDHDAPVSEVKQEPIERR